MTTKRLLTLVTLCVLADLVFSFLLYPRLSDRFLGVDGDGFGVLANSLLAWGRLSFAPGMQPTVFRGPGYPVVLACVNLPWGAVGHDRLVILQTALNAVTVVLLARIGSRVSSPRVATMAAVTFCLYPLAHVFVPRYLADTLLMTLLTIALASMLVPPRGNRMAGDAVAITAMTAAILVKQVMLPMALVLAALFWRIERGTEHALRRAIVRALLPMLLVLPWTLRNAELTGSFIPVHTGSGFNLVVGNEVARNFFAHPFEGLTLFSKGRDAAIAIAGAEAHDSAAADARRDNSLLSAGMSQLAGNPGLLVGKCTLNCVLFFTLGTSRSNSIVMLTAFLILLPFLAYGVWNARRHPLLAMLCIAAAIYSLLHVPVYAIGRFSIPIIPVMLLLAASGLDAMMQRFSSHKHSVERR